MDTHFLKDYTFTFFYACVLKVPYYFYFPDPPGMPSSPEVAHKTDDSVTLTWNPPDKDGGSPIKGYIIEVQDEDSLQWRRVNESDKPHPNNKFTVPDLQKMKKYKFRIIAVNAGGESEPSPGTSHILVKEILGNSHNMFILFNKIYM